MKEIMVEVVHYKTQDGKVFKDRQVAQIHEDKLLGKLKTCYECGGVGKISDIGKYQMETCFRCHGKGYLVKKEVWD